MIRKLIKRNNFQLKYQKVYRLHLLEAVGDILAKAYYKNSKKKQECNF